MGPRVGAWSLTTREGRIVIATACRARPARLALATAAAVLLLAGCLSADQQKDLDLINAARKANGRAAVAAHFDAAKKAQAWSETMARTGRLEHSGGGSKIDTSGLTGWCAIAENVGKGGSLEAVNRAFLDSSVHRANMLGRFDKVGTGVHKAGSTYWVTEIYVRTC
jgi:uncharacterized protein YkwD